jgi:glutaminyl-peptide cyclotransferase
MTRTARMVAAAAAVGAAVAAGFVWKPWADGRAAPADPPAPPKRDGFAQDKAAGGPEMKAVPFDAGRALAYLKQLCDIGPRVSGTDGMKKQQEVLTAHFEKHGATVTRQEFPAKQHSRKDKVGMTNLIASWHPDRPRRVILCSHYDTRPMAHEEPDRRSWNRPFISANDGTSGVAMFMEMAHHLKDVPTAVGVDLVLFDGEEYIFEPTGPLGGGDKFFFGSEHFADEYKKNLSKLKFRYEAAVLFDLFAHEGAVYRVEGHSFTFAPKLVEQVWQVAGAVGAKSFKWEAAGDVLDDHLALNRAGIPAVDVIDFDGYKPHWHKLTDTPDKVSGPQMAEAARVATAWLQLFR